MHWRPFLSATLRLVERHLTTAWQSAPMRLVSTPTSAVSKNSTGCLIRVLNSSDLWQTNTATSVTDGTSKISCSLSYAN